MSNTPLFSIVIPTRNRAHLLPHALKSALHQTFDDYEIVISANDCSDNTREIVKKFANSKINYFETNKLLTMPENWEYAWTKAKGKYITYLCDDDAISPSTLEMIAENALLSDPPVISWQDGIYYYPSWNDVNLQNSLLLFFYGDKLVEDIPAKNMNKELSHFNFQWSSPIPKLLNCTVNRAFFEEWHKRLGQLFFPIAPDYSFAWIATLVCENIRVINRPLSLRGISDFSIGSNAGLGEASKVFYKEFGNFEFFAETQNDLPLTINHVAATFLRINKVLNKNNISSSKLNSDAFNIALAKQLMECRDLLDNWEHCVNDFLIKAESMPDDLAKEIIQILAPNNEIKSEKETLRALHQRTRRMALEYLPNVTNSMEKHNGDLQCGLCTLALQDELLVDPNWNHLYVFGEKINSNNIYSMSLYSDRYYDMLLKCKNKLIK